MEPSQLAACQDWLDIATAFVVGVSLTTVAALILNRRALDRAYSWCHTFYTSRHEVALQVQAKRHELELAAVKREAAMGKVFRNQSFN